MALDFWDDVVRPAWYDVVQCSMIREVCGELGSECDSSSLDDRDYYCLAKAMRPLSPGTGSTDVLETHAVLAMMMVFCRSHSGVEHFIRSLRTSSPHNELVVTILEKIWHRMKDRHPPTVIQEHGEWKLKPSAYFVFPLPPYS